ncbi:DNA repair protein rad18 [Cryptococcus sp. DSM 104549]
MNPAHSFLSNIDDPPPFPQAYPQLQRLDRSVVCQICKEGFTAPVSVACGHSFCSQCIRSSLDVSKKCPSCNEPITEGSIRRNRALEEIADAWEQSRPTLIDLTKPSATRKRPPPPSEGGKAPGSSVKRLKGDAESSSRSENPKSGSSRKKDDEGGVLESEDEDEVQELTENDEAPCPMCQARLPIASIPMHIEKGCPPPSKAKKLSLPGGVKGNQKADWRKVFSGQSSTGGKSKEVEMKKITKPNYALTSPADLRNLLSSHSLPTTGDKLTLITRVQEWIILYNANLDSSHPSSLSALRAKLSDAEASRKRDREKGKDEVVEQLGTKEGLEKYAKEKKGEFERLRREIMERDKRRKEEEKGQGKESAIEVE